MFSTWHLKSFFIPTRYMLKEYNIKGVLYINNGIVIHKTHEIFIMIYKVVDIINTNVVLGTSTPFFKILNCLIIFECNGFMQCQLM